MAINVLVVDDHHIVRSGLRKLLEEDSRIIVVGEAQNGSIAITLSKELKPDIVIMDIAMPNKNGIAAIESIKREHPRIGIIALSMHMQEHYINGAFSAGADGYLLKDNMTEDLFAAIDAVLAEQYYISSRVAHLVVDGFIGRKSARIKPGPSSTLSGREQEILQMLAEGEKTSQIAGSLNISVKTVETHRRNIMGKTGANTLVDLVKYAFDSGIIQFETWMKTRS